MSKVISFRLDEDGVKQLAHVRQRCINNAVRRGDKTQEYLMRNLSDSTFAKIVFFSGLDYVAADLNRGATTTPPMGAK